MKALIWKDLRINIFVLGYGLVFLFGSLIVCTGINLYADLRYGALIWYWPDMLVQNGSFGLAFQLLTVVMLGGCSVAAERADRSAEFLAYLPPSRGTIIASKAILALGAGLLIWLADMAVAYWIAPLAGPIAEELVTFRGTIIPVLTASAVLLFGAAWCASTFAASHVLATGLGIAAPISILCSLMAIEHLFNLRGFDLGSWYKPVCLVLGVLLFIGGTVYYLQRVEP